MNYYGHTADDEDGRRLPEGHWQLLRKHLLNVAELAEKFATPFNLGAEAKLAGLLHDLGKYAKRFQDRLHDNSIHGSIIGQQGQSPVRFLITMSWSIKRVCNQASS